MITNINDLLNSLCPKCGEYEIIANVDKNYFVCNNCNYEMRITK